MGDKSNRPKNTAKKTTAGTPAAKVATENIAVTEDEMAGRRIAGGRDTEVAVAGAPENRYPNWTLAQAAANDDYAPAGSGSDTRGKIDPHMDTVEIGDCGPWFSANDP
jgi:hypothetical protein